MEAARDDKRAEEVMTLGLITIKASDPLRQAQKLMQEKNIRHLPVVDEIDTHRIIGIVSDRDLRRAMIRNPTEPLQSDHAYDVAPELLTRDFMHTPVRSVSEDVSLREVAETMLHEKISAVLVAESGPCFLRRYRGIITTDDLLRFMASHLAKDPANEEIDARSLFDEHFIESIGY